jgi:hypothetical protein
MKSFLAFFVFLFCLQAVFPIVSYGQNNTVTGVSGFYIPEKKSLNIGFTAFDMSAALYSGRNLSVSGGMRFIGATTGRRGGYFAFGYFSEALLRPEKRFRPGISMALLAGGGAAAPDEDGWLAQATVFSQYDWKNGLGVRAGLNYAYVSGGAIAGFSPVLGLAWKLRTAAHPDSLPERNAFTWNEVYSELGLGTLNGQPLGFLGAGAGWTAGKRFGGDFTIHALANAYGGYMQTLFSGGPVLSYRSFYISPALVIGLGGGGSAATKGGALYGAQLGLFYRSRLFHAGIKYQLVDAFYGKFGYNGLFVSAGKHINAETAAAMNWHLVTKAYLGQGGFGNIGARFVGYEDRNLRLMGSTYWAFTHNRGAYAEGLFEATYDAGRLPFYFIASFGAGAGAGINGKTASVIYSGGIGFASPWKKFPLQVEAAHWRGGNIPNWSIALSYRIGG